MRRLILAIAIFLFYAQSFGQNMKEELDGLRGQLDLPESTHIVMAGLPDLPTDNPIKIYLAVGFEMELQKNLRQRVDKWNKKDGEKYGLVEVVSDITKADVILAKYIQQEKVNNKTESRTNRVTGVTKTDTESYVPIYEYVIVQKPGRLEIVSREAKQELLRRSRGTGKLWDSFTKLLEGRANRNKG